ncbi:SIMPL domain-containing protein [Phenylobacterium sp. NIBR 498073]|uniref:SIMPL domain-containing protein n=1 Tax=Phenylobacterium sp. NIBR 498073 TaxID=3015177 RepID=UPI0022B4112D|nr:SIMPL domain-containing protein [Phenylobacterium sp. NIBR 498073]WGU41693.1 SIMPL domain-containing protein [Phenylobacterium sp. NIBR 498073]
MKTLVRAGAMALLLATAAAPAAFAQTAQPSAGSMFQTTTLNLSAYGETRVAPDKATINLGVVTEAPTAAGALAANNEKMNSVIAALRKAGIAERDIQTSGLNLNAQYDYVQNEPPKLRGYQASNQVTITVNDLAKLGAAVDATVKAGANQVNGISFGLKDPSAAENAARQEAVKALAAKADLYAKATGHRVSRLVNLSEGGGYMPSPPPAPMMAYARMEKADAGAPIAAGELNVRVDITGLYELSR